MPDDDDVDQLTRRVERVIPYVEDRRNSLIFEPKTTQSVEVITSLAYALMNAILVTYQLEDDEVACELLPNGKEPRYILLYEAAEGGAGVLRRLLKDPLAFPLVAREALRICHFNPDTGEDEGHAAGVSGKSARRLAMTAFSATQTSRSIGFWTGRQFVNSSWTSIALPSQSRLPRRRDPNT